MSVMLNMNMNVRNTSFPALAVTTFLLLGCSGCSGSGGTGDLSITASSGSALKAVAGDALALKVLKDGDALPAGATVTWSGVPTVAALDPSSTAASPLPAPGEAPTAAFITNPGRPDVATDLADVLFVLDPGTKAGGELSVTATVTGTATGTVTVSIPVGALPAGDATKGGVTYGANGANCAYCHGATAHGTDAGPDMMYMYDNGTYAYPAPGLNTESGNLGSDPTWNAPLLAMAARADLDNGALTLRVPMPSWLTEPNPATGQPLTTQDYADIYAWLKTQSQ
jgi:mono/diheme cytochrome c family protein